MWILLCVVLLFDRVLSFDIPQDCQRDGSDLQCKLRTINSDIDLSNFSAIPSDLAGTLGIQCSPTFHYMSSLIPGNFVHLNRLQKLVIEHCKLSTLPSSTFMGLNSLTNIEIRPYNSEWSSAVVLHVFVNSLEGLSNLDSLEITHANLALFPGPIFCSLSSLQTLNLSYNAITSTDDIGGSETLDCEPHVKVLYLSKNNLSVLKPFSFKNFRQLATLVLSDNGIVMLDGEAFRGSDLIESIDLSRNQLSSLPSSLFENFKNLQEVNLSNNMIVAVPSKLLSKQDKLLALDLSHNQLTSHWLQQDCLKGLFQLVILKLSNNKLTHVDSQLFSDLQSLQILHLDNNLIESLPNSAFSSLINLHTLSISNNKLARLDARALLGLPLLTSLYLDRNGLSYIHPNAFRNLTNLQELSFSGNALKEVPSALRDLNRLKTLDLADNSIEELKNGSFPGISGLFAMKLSGNRIRSIEKETFETLSGLKILNLASNRISNVEPGVFDPLITLEALRVDSNQLVNINGIFNNLPKLSWLNISENRIKVFDYAFMPKGLQWLDLHSNSINELGNFYKLQEMMIEYLDASFNKIKIISAINIPNRIHHISLNDNEISIIGAKTFSDKHNLTRVDLFANQLQKLELTAFQVNTGLQKIEYYVAGNPFVCDCDMEWLQKVRTAPNYPRLMDIETVYCRLKNRPDHQFMPISQIDSSQFLCSYKTHCFSLCHCCDFEACDCEMSCPSNCSCWHDSSWSVNIVDCTNGPYRSIPDRIPMDASEIHLDGNRLSSLSSHVFLGRKNLRTLYMNNSFIDIVPRNLFAGLRRLIALHLQDNMIKRLHGFEFEPLDSLRFLYLQNNRISHINNSTFLHLRQLEVLRLDGNSLHSMDVWLLSRNTFLIELHLSNNPWRCDCGFLVDFQEWTTTNRAKVSDFNQLECKEGSDIYILQKNMTNCISIIQPNIQTKNDLAVAGLDFDYISYLVIGVSLAAILLVLFCCLFYHRDEIYFRFFSWFNVRISRKDNCCDDSEKLYDAYISYSIKDENFLVENVCKQFEGCVRSYRLCLHHRDLPVTAYGVEAIYAATNASRRVVVLLSNNYIQSEWYRPGVRTLMSEIARDQSHRLIVIQLDRINDSDIDAELRHVLKSSTVIRWKDKCFWTRLRYYFPEISLRSRSSISPYHIHPIRHHHHYEDIKTIQRHQHQHHFHQQWA
ncbi:toll-like receptor 6 [Artemia franciscana]|uniref:TIR domain-containing protein n=1 Tax=Artemia franciscana TaxID=6661 RepID=A0AA88HNT6_ARTSF|nr:hypothetical protein QYM36_010040 [Artemia franciscana]